MGLTSFFKRKTPGDAPAGGARAAQAVDAVERVRTRTRQRLIGAIVLLTIGVIGFPLVFESQPRPIPIDIPIEIPRQDNAPALVLPAPRPEVAQAPAATPAPVGADAVVRESPADPMPPAETLTGAAPAAPSGAVASGKVDGLPASTAPVAAADPPAVSSPAEPATKAASEAGVTRSATTQSVAAERSDATAASGAAEGAARFVVQVGAFADPAAARELRSKLERLGLKTYAQVAETNAGRRTRVRLGPFATRAEADKALARSKAAGIAAVVLTL